MDIISAIYKGDEKLFDKLIDQVDINMTRLSGSNLLHFAIAEKQTKMAQKLIRKGIDVNHQTSDGSTPLNYASQFNNLEIAKNIISAGGIVDEPDNYGNTPLWYASFYANKNGYEMTQLLIDHKADPNHINKVGKKITDIATTFKDQKLLNILSKT